METQRFEIVSAQSGIGWTGRKVTGAHNGTIAIKEGTFTLNDGKLTGGKFVIDTTTIKILDITDPGTNAQFAGHLASDDFFSIEKFPEAGLNITAVEQQSSTNYQVAGDLTIKGIIHPVSFDLAINADGDKLTASARLVIDRTKYDMRFRSGNFFQNLGDNLIYNDFDLDVNVTAKAQPAA